MKLMQVWRPNERGIAMLFSDGEHAVTKRVRMSACALSVGGDLSREARYMVLKYAKEAARDLVYLKTKSMESVKNMPLKVFTEDDELEMLRAAARMLKVSAR